MKKDMWIRFFVAGLIALVTIVGTTENAEAQKFRFRDLFKKTNTTSKSKKAAVPPAGKEESAENKAEPKKETTDLAKKDDTAKKTAETPVKPTSSTSGTAKTATSKPKEKSNTERLKSLAGKLDKAETDPDTLLRSARERFRTMKEKESSSRKEPVAVARPSETEKKVAAAKEAPKTEKTEAPKPEKPAVVAKAAPVAALVKSTEKPMTGSAVAGTAKTTGSSRPPSLASVTAVAPVSVVAAEKAPPGNLQTSPSRSDVPVPKPLVSKKEKQKKSAAADVMRITSDEVEMDDKKRTTTFIGNVDLQHPTFHLTSDRLLIYMNDEGGLGDTKKEDEEEVPFKQAVATGATVIVERANAKGGVDVGQSRKAVFDARTGDLVLSGGPPVLQSAGGLVETRSEDATITLKKDGNHSVNKGKGPAGTVVIPIDNGKKGGAAKKQPNLIPTKLNDISNRKK